MTITGNPERDRMIYQAMKTAMANDQALSLDNVKALLPDDFDLLPKELVACRHAARLEPAPLVEKTPDGRPLEPAIPAESMAAPALQTDVMPEAAPASQTERDAAPEARLT